MKRSVMIGAFIAAALLAVVNNLTNKHSVAWFGSPEILPKPEGWPSLSMSQGVHAGIKVGFKLFHDHRLPIGIGVAALIALMFLLRRSYSAGALLRTAFRLGLGAMFLAAAWPKFSDPKGFAILVAQYQLLPAFAVNGFALGLAAMEIVVALGLMLTAWEKEFSALVGLLLLMFIVALGQALHRDLGIACGCFDIEGAQDAGETWFSLVRDVALLFPVLWMIMTGGRRFILGSKTR